MAGNAPIIVRHKTTRRRLGTAGWPTEPVPHDTGAAPPLWSATIRGEPTARAQMHDVVLTDGTARLIKSRPARMWQNAALAQLLNRRPTRPLAVDLALEWRLWAAVPRRDLDDALLIEVLERAAIIASAAQIREKHVVAAVDREDPRVMVRLVRYGGAA